MRAIIAADHAFTQKKVAKTSAANLFSQANEPFKVELIREIPDEEVSLYTDGDFTDLCRGPHIVSTGQVTAFKLLSVAGAYWRGNENNPVLQRIYGTAFHPTAIS